MDRTATEEMLDEIRARSESRTRAYQPVSKNLVQHSQKVAKIKTDMFETLHVIIIKSKAVMTLLF